jgi:hypothetical protein
MISPDFIYFEPTQWGPNFWTTIYYVAFSYDSKCQVSRDFVELFFYSIGGLLPCGDCQEHFHTYFNNNDIKNCLSDKNKLFDWIYNLQKEINHRNQKPFPNSFREWFESIHSKFFNL